MSNIAKLVLVTAVLLTLAACGGSGGSSGGTVVTVTPSGVQVLAGSTQQMTATASDGGTTFTWQVNGVTGGNGNVGTISTNGLYTAPNLPPPGGRVTITAIEQGNSGAPGLASLSIAYANVSLQGGYVFSLSGRNQSAPWFAIGEFSANGAGQISSGLQDINNGTTIQTKNGFTGSYSINPDGSGSLSLGNLNFQLVMQAGGQVLALSTTNGTILTGSLSVQELAAGSVSTLSGPLVLNASGQTAANQGIGVLAGLNAITTGAISGTEDVSGPNKLIRASITGSYAFDGNNHGTLTIKDSSGTHIYSFYVVSASDLAVLSNDAAAPINGSLSSQQSITYSNASLNGPYVFFMAGNSTTQGYVQAGQFNPNGQGSLGTVTEDINTPGNLQIGSPTTGTYMFDASVNGRGILTLNNQGAGAPSTYVFYMLAPQQAAVMTTNSSIVAGGLIVMQNWDSAFDTLSGAYGFALGAQTGAANLSAAVGTLSLNGNGNLSGKMLQNLNGSVSPILSLSGTYNLNGSARGTATLVSSGGGSSPFAIYPVNTSLFFLIGTDAASPYFGIAVSQ